MIPKKQIYCGGWCLKLSRPEKKYLNKCRLEPAVVAEESKSSCFKFK